MTRIARVYKHAATNDNSLDLDPFNRKLALVGIIPIKFSSLSAPTKIEELTAGSDEKTQRSPAGNRTPSDPAVSSSIFVGAEREENLIGMIPDKSEFTITVGNLFCDKRNEYGGKFSLRSSATSRSAL